MFLIEYVNHNHLLVLLRAVCPHEIHYNVENGKIVQKLGQAFTPNFMTDEHAI